MIELILKLEMSLWIEETRNSFDYMNSVLHNDFIEFGSSGKVYNKEDILNSLDLKINSKFPFENVDMKRIDESTILVTYVSVINDGTLTVKSNRSSIWIGKENFQLIFHQGTIIKDVN